MSYHFLLDLGLILLSTKLLSMLTRRFQMPQVVGALLAGLLLGPAVLNLLSETEFLSNLSELGVIVILFTAGIGTNLKELRHAGGAGFLVAVCGVFVPLIMGTAFGWIMGEIGWLPNASLLECVFLGTILTATSVSITVETLKELGKLDTKVGNTILAAALIDDVLGLIVLTVVVSMAGGSGSVLTVLIKIACFFVFAIVVALLSAKFFHWMIQREGGRDLRRYTILAFVLCLLLAYCAEEFFGVADIIGAFTAGLVIASTPKAQYIESKFTTLSYMLLTPVFFAGIGIKVKLPEMDAKIIIFSLILLAVAIGSKLIGCGLGSRVCGFRGTECIQIGTGMACRGEVALIVANRGLSMGVLSSALMTPVIIMVVGCAILTPMMLKVVFHMGASRQTDTYTQPAVDQAETESNLAEQYEQAEQLNLVPDKILEQSKKEK